MIHKPCRVKADMPKDEIDVAFGGKADIAKPLDAREVLRVFVTAITAHITCSYSVSLGRPFYGGDNEV